MIYKKHIKEHKVFSPHLIKLIDKAPGTKLREIIKTDWTLDQKINKEYFKFLLPYLNEPLKKFKRKVKDSGLLHEIQTRQFYLKPSAIKREKRAKARVRAQMRSKKATL